MTEELFNLDEDQLREIRERAHNDFNAKKKKWRQRGFWLVCVNCTPQVAVFIGPDKKMIGEKEDGTPILVKR